MEESTEEAGVRESTSKQKILTENKSSERIEEFRDSKVGNLSDYQYYDYDSSEMTDEDYL